MHPHVTYQDYLENKHHSYLLKFFLTERSRIRREDARRVEVFYNRINSDKRNMFPSKQLIYLEVGISNKTPHIGIYCCKTGHNVNSKRSVRYNLHHPFVRSLPFESIHMHIHPHMHAYERFLVLIKHKSKNI